MVVCVQYNAIVIIGDNYYKLSLCERISDPLLRTKPHTTELLLTLPIIALAQCVVLEFDLTDSIIHVPN